MELVYEVGDAIYRKPMNMNVVNILFVMPPNVPHAIMNRSDSQVGVLLEWADGGQYDVEQCSYLINA